MQLSVREFNSKVKNTKHLYKLASRAGYYLPAFESPLCNKAFLTDVVNCKVFLFQTNEIR